VTKFGITHLCDVGCTQVLKKPKKKPVFWFKPGFLGFLFKKKDISFFGLNQVFYGLSHISLLSTNKTFLSPKIVKTRKPCTILCRTVHKEVN
jgi:hypothetical protein